MIGRLQALLRHAFMAVEAVFNRAFGDRINPLYHLGSSGFWLFWIVAASGLYLYVFFSTSVTAAYASVEALSHGQRWIGGVLRSVHRYASDALVLVMLLHMLRQFAFDRLRGFRWFSWVSGIALIWLVYIAGINGFMLPWDRLAQFVAVASFEWIDWLPGFGGTLMRNFVHPDSVSDRFFSLLAFIHIGVSLLMLLMLWIHVQRVPKAELQPPRPIAASFLAMLLLLSLLLPVLSQQGPADLARVVADVELDWFILPALPLLYLWSPGALWLLVIGTSVLLAVLPWLGATRRRGAQHVFQVAMHPGPHHLNLRGGENLLDGGLRHGLALPYECRNGACGLCVCTVVNGRVDPGAFQPAALSAEQRAAGQVLMCCATPLEDVEIEVPVPSLAVGGDAALPIRRARVVAMDLLGPDLMRLRLETIDGEKIAFAAGQYLNIVLDDEQRRAFSFANPPHDNALVELHVRLIPGGRFTTHVFDSMRVGDELRLEGPLGRFTLHASDRPILFVAGATGFAPVKSILEDAFARGVQRPMWLYWGARRPADLYLATLAEHWQREHPHFHFVPVLSDARPEDGWQGRVGLVHEAMLADFADLSGHEIYVCGSVAMVESAVPEFLAHGAHQDACFSDAFHSRPQGPAAAAQPETTR